MDKKIDYGIIAIVLIGAIFVLLGYFLLVNTLIQTDHWAYTLEEWREIEERVDPGTKALINLWFYVFVTGIFISLGGNFIALGRIFIKRSLDRKIDYGIGVILLTGVILVLLGYFLLINRIIEDNLLDYLLWEWYEIEISMSPGTLALVHFWFYVLIA